MNYFIFHKTNTHNKTTPKTLSNYLKMHYPKYIIKKILSIIHNTHPFVNTHN